MEPCTAETLTLEVPVAGRVYLWHPVTGLDPAAVETVHRWIWRQSLRLESVARRQGYDVEDLVQEGQLGALKAASRFEPSLGGFLNYAAYWVRAYQFRLLGISRGHFPVAHASLDEPLPDRGTLADFLRDETSPDLDAQLDLDDLKPRLRHLLASLDARRQEVIRRRFGLGGKPQTLQEAGTAMGLSRERIRQLERDALAQLRHLLGVQS